MDYGGLEKYKDIGILFTESCKDLVQEIYDHLMEKYTGKRILLSYQRQIICPLKTQAHEFYVLAGSTCPLHSFHNCRYYRKRLEKHQISIAEKHEGPIYMDSIYSTEDLNAKTVERLICNFSDSCVEISEASMDYITEKGKLSEKTIMDKCKENVVDVDFEEKIRKRILEFENANILIISESSEIVRFFGRRFDEISVENSRIQKPNIIKFLIRENNNGELIKTVRLIGVIYTSIYYEELAGNIIRELSRMGKRGYNIYLKEISYERLISIDFLECIILIDCPLFEFSTKLHIPVITPFSLSCKIKNRWEYVYIRNWIFKKNTDEEHEEHGLTIMTDIAKEIYLKKEHKGVSFHRTSDDITVYEGMSGIPAKYKHEDSDKKSNS